MSIMALVDGEKPEVTYGIYTIERLPKGAKRTPKWDLHSTAQDRMTAEVHAKTLAAQPYFDYIEVQEFKTCPETKTRTVNKIRSYSRKSSKVWMISALIAVGLIIAFFVA